MNIFLLLYADDTVILAESEVELQKAINSLFEFCRHNKLQINTSKSKIMVFLRGKIRKKNIINFGVIPLEVVDDFIYLGIVFNYNGKFNKAITRLIILANKAMFAILSRGRQLCLDIDTQMHLFYSVITPILLYGCEVWGFSNLKLIERVQLRFSKLIMKVKKSTPTVMIQGELSMYPLQTKVKNQMISYWTKLITGEHARYICQMYNLLLLLDCSKWLGAIQV